MKIWHPYSSPAIIIMNISPRKLIQEPRMLVANSYLQWETYSQLSSPCGLNKGLAFACDETGFRVQVLVLAVLDITYLMFLEPKISTWISFRGSWVRNTWCKNHVKNYSPQILLKIHGYQSFIFSVLPHIFSFFHLSTILLVNKVCQKFQRKFYYKG